MGGSSVRGITTNAPITIPLHIAEKDLYWVRDAKKEPVAVCPTRAIAEMIVAALEQVARDGETFILEDGKCK